MRALVVCGILAAVTLSGCADDPASDVPATASGDLGADGKGLAMLEESPVQLRFTTPPFEGNLSGTETFSITAQCAFECQTGGESVIDLTPVIPSDAPVELTVAVHGANSVIRYTDAFAIGIDSGVRAEYDGQKTSYAGLMVRAATGTVTLHVYNPGGFGIPPEPAPTASWEARGVVRPDSLVAGLPASLPLSPGDRLQLPGTSVEEAILIAPDGSTQRDQAAPFELVANGTAGEHVLIMLGSDSTPVLGPDVPLRPRRLARVEEEPHALDGPASWTFTPAGIPLQLGIVLQSGRGPAPVPLFGGHDPASFSTGYSFTVTGPTGARVLAEEQAQCRPLCAAFRTTVTGPFLDEGLRPGTFDVDVQFQGRGSEAFLFATVVV